jgi:hypothetical protein
MLPKQLRMISQVRQRHPRRGSLLMIWVKARMELQRLLRNLFGGGNLFDEVLDDLRVERLLNNRLLLQQKNWQITMPLIPHNLFWKLQRRI